MDLLCTESLVTHSEQSTYICKEQTPVSQKNTRPYNIICNCKSSYLPGSTTVSKCNTSSDARAKCNPVVSLSVPVDCNMSKLVYVFASVGTPIGVTYTTKPTKSTSNQSVYQFSTHQFKRTVNLTCTAVNNKTECVGDKHLEHVNPNMVVNDPILRSDRCLENALKSEEKYQQVVDTYFKTVQKDITPPMRKIVAEWMMEVCAEEKCQKEVVLLAINYMDRFLSTKSVRKIYLQTLAASCLLLASKLREPSCRALSAELLVFYTDNSICKDDLIKWELYVLSRLGWNLSSVTPLDFLELLIVRLPKRYTNFSHLNINKVRQHAQAFISLAAKDHTFSKYTASTIAASSIAASISGLKWHLRSDHNMHYLLSLLTDLTSVGQDKLQHCMIQMEAIFEDHTHLLQPFFIGVEKPQSINGFNNGRQQQRQQKPILSVLPKLSKSCKNQAESQKEIQFSK